MKIIGWGSCGAIVLLASVSVRVDAQNDPFGDIELETRHATSQSAGPAEESPLNVLTPIAVDATNRYCKCVGQTDSATVTKIRIALTNPLRSSGIEFTDAPVEEVIQVIQDEYGIPIQLDIQALDEIGIGPDEPVTMNARDISLRSALRLMLKQLQLTYVIENEVLMITTPEQAESELIACVYDVRDLTSGQNEAAGLKSLAEAITECVQRDTWKENGPGNATIRPLKPGLLVISQTRAVHEAINRLLESIRELRSKRPAAIGNAAEAGDASAADGDASGGRGGRAFFGPRPGAGDD